MGVEELELQSQSCRIGDTGLKSQGLSHGSEMSYCSYGVWRAGLESGVSVGWVKWKARSR
mgnify:CR=1 FL=1